MSLPKVLLLDGDGVIWIDKVPIKGSIEALNRINSMGVRLVLVTNNCSKTQAQYLKFMQGMGLQGFNVEDVFSSGYATAMYLLQHGIKNVFVCGFNGLVEELRLHGIEVHTIETDPEPQKVDAVVISKSETFTFDEISRGIDLVIKFGARLIGTNPDPNFPLAHGVLIPGSGACARTFEEATGVKATLIGKPEDPMFETVLTTLGVTKDEVIMVGDRIITDIAFASHHGARSILVLSGIDTQKDVDETPESDRPTYVLPSLVEVAELFESMRK
ncbi:haloacid dehalogenase-like hydrolase family protein [Tritrichomonas foetus]|uniref:Haloacid dehalogenase-like hydrolase family protein n=1 Tax=Tritrichomonas foetus TaxID=1144522 RepID=A0A1J4KHM1_9EUKA|nr:haloacid dehalogenase-like hydrolase family protein [Tritrichomonas foetus]|eukprot:OHT10538.1 haloacid dehalogenase-like hydrolase family protein [Tritrichomonas foetus]